MEAETMIDIDVLDRPGITKPHLEQLELIVRGGLQSFMAVGLALIEIRESRGYQLRGFFTFEEYCQGTFGFTARHGRRLIQAAQTADEVAGVTGINICNAGVARALSPVVHDPNAIRHVKARIEARGQSFGRAPAAVISRIIGELMAKPRKPEKIMGECPVCRITPRAYRCIDGYWQCGSCGTEVSLKVFPA